ncbi:superoxide dismutase family protein [Streptomyces sp. NPDC006610]|jgi:Cu-Zn family superoxide dismutase|uniref:superoxide dismutase family protein n=1 Tax=Streptomyces sp. NPDC006610 TaxID=3154584 RepID=UPI0033B4BF67
MVPICAGALAVVLLTGGDPSPYSLHTDARFAPPSAAHTRAAVTYDRALVPVGARIAVGQRIRGGGAMTVELRVAGVRPGHHYGVHVHREPCGADPAAAGGHYQHRPGAGPHHVSPDNEVWLDFAADRRGEGHAVARHDWRFRRGEASSVVIHDVPGGAGERVACFTVPFG